MSKKARVFSREFKLMVVRRLLAGEKMSVVAQETKVLRKDLYIWRDRYRAGGLRRGVAVVGRAEARRWFWRSPRLRRRGRRWCQVPLASALLNWSVRSASSRSNWIFFGKPCGRSRRRAGRATGLA
jgi:hypothetical protein